MENQHRKIKGYRELTQEEIDLMNQIKEMGVQLDTLCDKLYTKLQIEMSKAVEAGGDTFTEFDNANPLIWLYDGRSTLQKGLMFLTRSVARPGFF